jgi:predicted ATP-dependent serine protease
MMHSLHRTFRKKDNAGQPIVHGLKSFDTNKIWFRRSELSMISAVAGQGKSSLALAIALTSGMPTLYVSADTNHLTQSVRVLSMLTGRLQDDIEIALETHPEWCEKELRKAGHIRWIFDSSPSMQDIEDEIKAFMELSGEPPAIIVVDNASDVVIEGAGDEWATLRELMRSLKFLAREYDSAVLALHHSSDGTPSDPCPARASIQGKVSQVPAVICTMASTDGWMAVAPVKNRFGPADHTGNTAVFLDFEPARMFIADGSGGAR